MPALDQPMAAVCINTAGLSDLKAGYVRDYLRLRNVEATAKLHNITADSMRRRLHECGIKAFQRKAIELGAPYSLTDLANPAQAQERAEVTRMDVVERHRFTEDAAGLKSTIKELTARLATAEDHRASILGLSAVPLEPIFEPVKPISSTANRQACILHLTDLHMGEVINREEVAGVNEYNVAIAKARIARAFHTAGILMTEAWPRGDAPPSALYLFVGGDLISGHGLHPEHAETDAGTAYQQVRWCAESIAGGIIYLRTLLDACYPGLIIPIEVVSVVGNHGRMTFGKPRTKLVTLQSYDTLVADFSEAGTAHLADVQFYRPRGFDAYVSVVGWPMLLTHGDRMGSGGGTGFIGPMATIIKGHRKIVDTEYRQRRPIYKVFSGHYHTTGVSPFGLAGGSGCGYGEFAKSIRADPEPAQQNFVVIHERMGLIRWHPINLGTPEEGSIYEPRGGIVVPLIGE